ncbi:MAG: cytochrome C oxidase subunit IV family protein [Bacteroidales bacterium]
MEKTEEHKIVSFKTYIIVLLGLIALTFISVLITKIDLGNFSILIALTIAGIKSLLVFAFFMHLIYDNRMYSIMVIGVIVLFTLVLIVTFLDYRFL